MGQLIVLADHLADRSRPSCGGRAAFFYDLACPFSYLLSEQVERVLGDVEWVPVASMSELHGDMMAEAERRARSLRLPLVWPDKLPLAFPRAARAAAYAASVGRSAAFALAAGRLAFCGGFDLDDVEILADAAAAAGISPAEALAAASARSWDEQLQATVAGLQRRGIDELPAIRVGATWHSGPRALAEAGAMMRALDVDAPALSRG